MKHKTKLSLVIAAVMILAGCTPAPNVQLSPNFWQNHKQKVIVANDRLHVARFYQEGSEGILDIAANDMVSTKLRNYLNHYPVQSTLNIQNKFIKKLKARNINAKAYNKQIDISKLADFQNEDSQFAGKNYIPLAAKIGNHKLLIVSANRIGATRNYYGFIPLGAPKAVCDLTGRLIDLRNNKILWRYTANVELSISGNWDQPPNYPNLNKTIKLAIVTAQQELLDGFFDKN